jgi:Dienelactone hydrolase family
MKPSRQASIEQLEPRSLSTLVFVFNGNAFAEAKPNQLTQSTAELLNSHDDRAIQLTMPAMDGPGAFYQVANEVRSLSKGRPIGLLGFSAGGTLALRLAGVSGLNVKAVAAFYGPPDLRDWLQYHHGDRDYRFVTTHVQLDPAIINLLSGPSATSAYVIDAFGLLDHNVVAGPSTVSFERDFPDGRVYDYAGPHGVKPTADPAALADFLNHL